MTQILPPFLLSALMVIVLATVAVLVLLTGAIGLLAGDDREQVETFAQHTAAGLLGLAVLVGVAAATGIGYLTAEYSRIYVWAVLAPTLAYFAIPVLTVALHTRYCGRPWVAVAATAAFAWSVSFLVSATALGVFVASGYASLGYVFLGSTVVVVGGALLVGQSVRERLPATATAHAETQTEF